MPFLLTTYNLKNFHIIDIIKTKTGLSPEEIAYVLTYIEPDEKTKQNFSRIHQTLHDKNLLEELHTCIRQKYWKENISLSLIIEQCRDTGYNDVEIAAASLHMSHKKKDRVIFQEMKKAL